jgi:hypothetical protein
VDFDAYVSVDQELLTCGVVGSGSCVEKGQGDGGDDDGEAESESLPSSMEALCAFE